MHQTGTATNYADLLDKLNTFLTGTGSAFGLTYSGTGDGTFTAYAGGASSVAETFTITATSSSSFDVVGSVSGSIGPATVGTPFSHAKIAFTLTAGGTAFIAGDVFTINTAPAWTSMRATASTEMIWKAPGNDGLQSIYVGATVFSNATADYYNWRLGGFSGYNGALTFANQPGACTRPVLPLWNSTIPYWFIANGNRVIVIAKISTVYEMAYLGFLDRLMSPGQMAYPLMVGGSMSWNSEPASTSTNWRWSYSGNEHSAFWCSRLASFQTAFDDYCQCRFRKADGTWRGFAAVPYQTYNTGAGYPGIIWPYWNNCSTLRENLDGTYPLFDVFLWEIAVPNVYGYMDGLKFLNAYSLGAETAITIGIDSHIVIPDVNRSGRTNYVAVKLD